jgi:hypothetical protein
VHRHDHAQRRVDVFELLACAAEADVIHARAAVFGRHADTQQAQVGHLRQDLRIELVRAIELADLRRHFAPAPLAYGLLEQLVLVRQIEVNHDENAARR